MKNLIQKYYVLQIYNMSKTKKLVEKKEYLGEKPRDYSRDDFLRFPGEQFCSTIFSIGPPRSGKTYLVLECMKAWLQMGMFEDYICIIPNFKNEMTGSYDWMLQHDNITIYESIHAQKLQELVDQKTNDRKLLKEGKIEQMPRTFVFIDDATAMGQNLFNNDVIVRLATENRHLAIHTWLCLHYAKGVIKPAVRNNIRFIFVYPISVALLKQFHGEFIPPQWEEFEKYDDFIQYFKENVTRKEYGCLLIAGKDGYTADCPDWFAAANQKKKIKNTTRRGKDIAAENEDENEENSP